MAAKLLLYLRTAIILSQFCYVILDFSPHIVETQLLWDPNDVGDVASFRIPIATRLPNGTVIALAEARKGTAADSGAKFLALRFSHPNIATGSGAGDEWTPTRFLMDDYQARDGLNIGAIIVDEMAKSLIFIYSVCAHTECPSRNYLRGNYMKRSKDWGASWEDPVDISNVDQRLRNISWSAGPGYGIQKKYAPHKGRLIACGHINDLSILRMMCIISDDHGDSWHMGAEVYHIPYRAKLLSGDFAPTEVQMVELYNGTILFNARNEGRYRCSCHFILYSFDGATTIPYETIRTDSTLIDPVCQASLLLNNGILYFTNPASTSSRVQLTLRWSMDFGETWAGSLLINEGASEYSCLTAINDNNIGIVYEHGSSGLWFVKIRLNK